METGKKLTGTDEKSYQHAYDTSLSVHFLAIDEIASQELDLMMAVLDDIVAEMRRLESEAVQGVSPDRSYRPIQGERSC